MKIVLFDPNGGKFTDMIVREWEKRGHEVQHTLYYDPAMAQWADVIWFETCDNNLRVATNANNEPGFEGWNLREFKRPDQKVVCRAIDIDIWTGIHNGIDWSLVDDVIFIAPHIQKKAVEDLGDRLTSKQHLIYCGVDTDKFTMKKSLAQGKKIAWVSERWHAKGVDLFLQFASVLYNISPGYKIYAVGIWADDTTHGWYKAYIDQFLEENKMNVEFIERVGDMNDFLEDKDYCITFSKKEAFSYAIAEGMSKGIKPLIHNFYGAKGIWDEKYVWNTVFDAIKMIYQEYYPKEYRKYIEDNYSLKIMMDKIDEVIK